MKKAQIIKLYMISHLLLTPHLRSEAAIQEAFRESLSRSENVGLLKMQKDKDDAYVEALSARLYPAFKLLGNARYGNNTFQTRDGLDRLDTNLALNLSHPLFQGGAEYPLYKLKILLPKKNEQVLSKDLKDYFLKFLDSYTKVASAIEEEEKQVKQIENLGKRLQLLESRVKIGQDKRSDLFLLRAQLLRLKADHSEIKSRVEQNLKAFYTLTALSNKPYEYFKDSQDPSLYALGEDFNLSEQRDYQVSQSLYEAARYEAMIAKSAYLPKVNLAANYYLDQYRSSRDDWDLTLTLSMNLFDFGETAGTVAQARLASMMAEKNWRLQERELGLEWQELLSKFRFKKEQYQHLASALDFSKKSYEDQLRDLSRGLINQIEVIRALDDIINLEKVVIKAAHDLRLFYFQAQAFRGNVIGEN